MKIARLETAACRIPTARPEADGTFEWDSTTMGVVEAISESGLRGLGYPYGAAAGARLIQDMLSDPVVNRPVEAVHQVWEAMVRAVRNVGRPGIASHAKSTVDGALWDLRACAEEKPLYQLRGAKREAAPIYGSGGFKLYTFDEQADPLAQWVEQGIPRVKVKLGKAWGTCLDADIQRVRIARESIGTITALFVDANGAYAAEQAIRQAPYFQTFGVSSFEEPVVFDQLDDPVQMREAIEIPVATGEYGYDIYDFQNVPSAGAADIRQADATRGLGITDCLQTAELAAAHQIPFSTHTAHSIHLHVGCASPQIEQLEYFYDHVRIENMLLDGPPQPMDGYLRPDASRPGLGLELKRKDAERWKLNA
jgi:L-alanine-DL-glutamate epimerase-like enolase superfamily enzyme